MRIFYLSWIAPIEGSGASLAMRRHFVEHRDFEVFVATTADFSEPGIPSLKLKRAPWLQRLFNTRFVRLVRNFELLFYGTQLEQRVLDAAREFRPDAVFTVADMTLCEQARKLANLLAVPLVVNFQDWWPRGQFYYWHEKPYFWVRSIVEWRFRRLYREADLAFCTSEGMKEFLGPHPNSHVLYPIGARDETSGESRETRDESEEERAKTDLTTIERLGGREKEQPKVGPKGEGVGTTVSNDTDGHNQAPGQVCGRLPQGSPEGETSGNERVKYGEAGPCLDKPSGAAFSNPFTSELARDSENTSLIRSADNPSSLPATSDSLPVTAPEARPFDGTAAKRRKKRLIYTGTAFGSYGKMLRELARELEKQDEWELVIFGNTPDWPKEELERAKETGLYRGMLKFDELQRELHEADACLAVMSFEPELEVMMRTSFTTKMLDYCRIGKPLILWGPEYCSPIRLAIRARAGLCVVNNDPNILVDALKNLDKYFADNKITKGAKYLSKNDLNHSCIHNVLVSNILAVVR